MSESLGQRVVHLPGRALNALLIGAIRFYQRFISPLSGPSCKYYPTCSAYGVKALQVHGPGKGVVLTGWRLLRCNPWSKGGIDPVPAHGHWHPAVYPDGRPRPSHATADPTGAVVKNSATIRDNDVVDIASTSTESDSTASMNAAGTAARPSGAAVTPDPAPRVEAVLSTDLDADGSTNIGPRQENA